MVMFAVDCKKNSMRVTRAISVPQMFGHGAVIGICSILKG